MIDIKENVSIAPYTTFGIGGIARFFTIARSVDDLAKAYAFAEEKRLPVFVLGGGSNSLVSDAGWSGLVIKNEIGGIKEAVSAGSIVVEAAAGEPWDPFVGYCVEKGYWGLENLSLIPGTVGAAPVQNIGAYGREAKDVIESVTVFDPLTKKTQVFSNEACGFSYRDSIFKHGDTKRYVIVAVSFKLGAKPDPNIAYKDLADYFSSKGISAPSLADIRKAVIEIRSGKFPDLSKIGTAGSFWKNPVIVQAHFDELKGRYPDMPSYPSSAGMVKVSLAWILDRICGLKGFTKGAVGLYDKQPLVLVAAKGSRAADVLAFADSIEAIVAEKTGINVEKEVFVLE